MQRRPARVSIGMPVFNGEPFVEEAITSILAQTQGDFELVGSLTGREPDVNSASVGMSDLYHYYSIARAQQELGYVARPLEESIADAWNWFQAEGYA